MSSAKLSVSPILSPSPGGAAARGAATGVLLRYPSRGCVPRSGASRLSERQGAGFGGGSYRLKWKVTPKLQTRRPGLGGWLQYSTNGSGGASRRTNGPRQRRAGGLQIMGQPREERRAEAPRGVFGEWFADRRG